MAFTGSQDVRIETTRAGTPTATAPARHVFAHDGAGADDGVRADGDAVEDLGARPGPGALANRHAQRAAALLEHGLRGIREVVIAADHVGVGRHQHASSDAARGWPRTARS